MRNFKPSAGDADNYYLQREITGRFTIRRYKAITKFMRDFNRKVSAPYGVSPSGYPYRCGCEHDCCGCLVSEGISIEGITEISKGIHRMTLGYSRTYNY